MHSGMGPLGGASSQQEQARMLSSSGLLTECVM